MDYPFISYYMLEPVENKEKENNMAKSWLDMLNEGRFYVIDDEGNVVDFGKARGWDVETCIGCEPEVTLRVTPIKVMKNEGASAYSFERECVEYRALKAAREENLKLIEQLKKENKELRQKLANYESDMLTQYAYNDPKAVYLSTGRSNGKTKMLKEVLNMYYGTKGFKYDIKKVIFSGPCTIVFWQNGTKTIVRQQEGDALDKEKGLAMAIAKRVYGDKGSYNNIFKRWLVGKDWRKKERLAKKMAKLNEEVEDEHYKEDN